MQEDNIYTQRDKLLSNEDLLIKHNNNEEVDMIWNSRNALLIDLVKNYPHLYNKSSANYKDSLMKANSWNEIGTIMHWTPDECQNRWTRLRERFSRERREIEADSRSGSGASQRKGFVLYENMKFLNSHVLRRRTFTNILQEEKNKENIPQISAIPDIDATICSPTISKTQASSVPANLYMKYPLITSSVINDDLLNIVGTNADDKQSTSSTTSSVETHAATEISGTCSSKNFDYHNKKLSITPPTAVQSYTNTKTPRKRSISDSDDIEKSFLSLSATIKEKIQNSNVASMAKKDEKDAEDKFADLILVELRKLAQTERQEKKKKIIDILWS